jgi:hypothetical protein
LFENSCRMPRIEMGPATGVDASDLEAGDDAKGFRHAREAAAPKILGGDDGDGGGGEMLALGLLRDRGDLDVHQVLERELEQVVRRGNRGTRDQHEQREEEPPAPPSPRIDPTTSPLPHGSPSPDRAPPETAFDADRTKWLFGVRIG